MSTDVPRPDEKAESRGNADSPGEPVRPNPSLPATTSDFLRFPEHGEASEITSVVNPDPPKVGDAAGAKSPSAPPPSGGGSANGNPDFDPQIEIERRIGVGGMGEVFLGLQKHLGRKVAVKRIRDWGEDRENKERFIREAKAQACLQHPGIAQVYDLREAEGALYLIMEHVLGKTLEEVLKTDGKFAPQRIAQIGAQLTEALEAAAHEGYIHRDLKPGNVMLTEEGKVKIIDFGLALRFRNLMQTRFTEKGEVLGTPAYMSPEQLNQEEKLDVRSDIWSLGVLLYALSTGEPPFTGKDFVCTVKNVMMAEPVPLPLMEEGFPPGLWDVIKRALRKDRAERWQDYPSFRQALLEYEVRSQGVPSSGPAAGVTQAPRPFHRALIGLGVAAALLVAAVFGSQLFSQPKEDMKKPAGESAAQASKPAHGPAGDRAASLKISQGSEDQPVTGKSAPEVVAEKHETAGPPKSDLPPKPSAPVIPLRQQLAQYPLVEGDSLAVTGILAVYSKHREELLNREYDPLIKDLASLASSKNDEYVVAQVDSAQELARLASDLVRDRWREIAESKEEIRLKLQDGSTAQGTVESADKGALTLANGRGGKIGVELTKIASEEFLREKSVSMAEIAYQALSGDAGQALVQARELEKVKEKVALWYPVLLRLARLGGAERIRGTIAQAEAPLARKDARHDFEKTLSLYPRTISTLRGISEAETELCAIYPFLGREFKEVRREGEALELLLDGAYSKVLVNTPGTEAQGVAATLLLADFLAKLEPANNDLIGKAGWFNYKWELRPDETSIKDRLQYWDLLEKGGCVIRDPKGPRSLIMSRPHPRCSEGFVIDFAFEPLGEEHTSAEWRFNLRREGGGTSYLRFDEGSVSLRTSTLGAAGPDETLVTANIPGNPTEPRSHTCILVPGELLHVFLDGALVLSLKKEDTILPNQPSLVVRQGKLSIRSILVMKKPPQ